MTRVWLVQCLCGPNRHAIAALAGEFDGAEEAQALVEQLRSLVAEIITPGGINPWCAICGALEATWRYELGRTRFATMAEAEPHLQYSQARNLIANMRLGTHGPNPPKRQ